MTLSDESSPLVLHGEEIESVFALLGDKENAWTYSLGWVLSQNKDFLKVLIKKIQGKYLACDHCIVKLQEHGQDRGFTDIELRIDNDLFIIIEAKRGWILPDKKQLNKYERRFDSLKNKPYKKMLVVISECRKEYAKKELEKLKLTTPIKFLSWREVVSLIEKAHKTSNKSEKRLLKELNTYLKKVVSMVDKNSNKVFCVVLSSKKEVWSRLSFVDIVRKKGLYYYPFDKGWPSDPPNYIAFRYQGKLMSIHHVDDDDIVTKLPEAFGPSQPHEPHVLLKLGKPFKPSHEVKNGKIYPSQHLRFDLDTIFTSKTIREARDLTDKRDSD